MDKIGCTTPFGLELDNICTEQNKSLEALEMFWDILWNQKKARCLYPCNFLKNQITTTKYRDETSADKIMLTFDEYIKVTTSNYGYTELELLAELGGYVGLFLGISVFDLRLVFSKIFNIFMQK